MPPELTPLARASAQAFRLGLVAQGNELLARLIDGLLARCAEEAAAMAALAPRVAQWSAAQRRGDWIGLADALEFADAGA